MLDFRPDSDGVFYLKEGVVWMNAGEQKLFERLKKVLSSISQNPKTAIEVTRIFEDFVVSLEEIADELDATSDERTAATLRAILHATTRASTGRLTAI